jgi:hypothetical protein
MGIRASEMLGLRWDDILWERSEIKIKQTFVNGNIQGGAKTNCQNPLSRCRIVKCHDAEWSKSEGPGPRSCLSLSMRRDRVIGHYALGVGAILLASRGGKNRGGRSIGQQ